MRTASRSPSTATTNQLFAELLSVTHKAAAAAAVPVPPPPPSAAAQIAPTAADRREQMSATLLRQVHRVVCNQAWSLRHVPEPVVQHRIVVPPTLRRAAPAKKIAVLCASASRPFPFRHVDTRVKHGVVVGVRDACMRLTLRAIQRGELPALKVTTTRVAAAPVVGVREAWTQLTLRAIRRSEFTLKPATTRVSRGVVVLAAATAPKKSWPKASEQVQLNHVQTRVRTAPIVGVRDAVLQVAQRAIVRGEFALKPTPETRVTHAVVVQPKNASRAALFRRHAALLAQLAGAGSDAFEAVRAFEALDQKTRSIVVELLGL